MGQLPNAYLQGNPEVQGGLMRQLIAQADLTRDQQETLRQIAIVVPGGLDHLLYPAEEGQTPEQRRHNAASTTSLSACSRVTTH